MGVKIGELRPSQFITTFGPGAIVDLPDYSVIMAGINKWKPGDMSNYSYPIKERRIMQKLRINEIKSIPVNDSYEFGTLPAYRFPEYHVCPNCRKLGKKDGREFIEDEGAMYCKNPENENDPCPNVKTHPIRFLTACKSGHIDDFPWEYYVHSKHGKKYDRSQCKLYLRDEGKTGSLKDLIVECRTCDIERPISEVFQNKNLLSKCRGRRPWLGRNNLDPNGCNHKSEILLRGASNIYFSSVESSIEIPTDSNELEDIIRNEVDFSDEELINIRSEFDSVMKRNNNIKQLGLDKAWEIVQQLKDTEDDSDDLLTPEFRALTSQHNNFEGVDFELERQEVPNRHSSVISNLVRVKRLKEVVVLKGFTRIHPLPDVTKRLSDDHKDNKDNNDEVEMAPLSDENTKWLPGVETYGEGIFITIDESKLRTWEEAINSSKYELAHKNLFRERNVPDEAIPEFPGVRYILLHTLSHALIRELTLHSGYSSSALKERIYSNSEKGMAGILIYTATVDSEGSLGGLVELGEKDYFEMILARALDAAKYCSGDPLCAEHNAGNDINGAACHSCLLISETSCERSNRYLDRSLLVETVSNGDREYFFQ